MTAVKYFDGRETGNSGLYIQPYDTIFINAYLDDIYKKKVLYHEMGHVGQYLENYSFLKENLNCKLTAIWSTIYCWTTFQRLII